MTLLDKIAPYMDEPQVTERDNEVRPTLVFAVWACLIGFCLTVGSMVGIWVWSLMK